MGRWREATEGPRDSAERLGGATSEPSRHPGVDLRPRGVAVQAEVHPAVELHVLPRWWYPRQRQVEGGLGDRPRSVPVHVRPHLDIAGDALGQGMAEA